MMPAKTYPLGESQLGMFLEWNADRDSTQYSLAYVFRLGRKVDPDAVERAVMTFVNAHPVFRTRFTEVDGEVRQYSDERMEIPFVRSSMTSAEAEGYVAEKFPRPFDLFAGPLCRFELIDTPDGYLFIEDISHLIVDGTTLNVFRRSISEIYGGGRPIEEKTGFAEYVAHEAEGWKTAEYKEAAEAAKARFAGKAMTVPEMGGESEEGRGKSGFLSAECRLTDADNRAIDAYCRANGLHPNLFFMGVFARVLALYANEREVMFYTVNHGRRTEELKNTLGLLVRTVPVLGELKGGVLDYFRGFRLHKAGVYPFTHFCRDLGITPGWGFVFQEGTLNDSYTFGSTVVVGRDLMCGGAGTCPVMQVFGENGSYRLKMTATPGRYDDGFLKGFCERCATFAANAVAADANAALASVPVLSEPEMSAVKKMSKGEELDYDRSRTFVDRFLAMAETAPEAVAVVDCETSLTYGELAARSNALAERLVEAGVKSGGFVGLMLPRRVGFVEALIAVQRCGAGYVPLDADYPTDRLAYMLENSEAKVLVTTKGLFADKGIDFKGKVLFLDEREERGGRSEINCSAPDTPAYMIYTSGSTGKPKGVVLPNRALSAFVAWFVRDCGLKAGKRNLSITSFSFDASVPDIFPPLAAGGELHILSEETRKDLEGVRNYADKVSATGLTTSTQLGLALVNTYPELPLEYMMLGGEKMVPFAKTKVRMLNGYGPTEFTVCSSYHEVDQAKNYDIPIGKAVPNTWSLVVDKLGALVPAGMVGELALAGEQLADGYWKLAEKTASVFVEGPVGRMYRTGDLARYNADGELEFLGRIDFQVKLRGFRIEIGEVEHAAASFPGVKGVAAEVKEIAGAKHLVLYYEGADVDAAKLKAKMAGTLTEYMVPDFFVKMDALPLTPNGKIDRRKLPVPQADDEPSEPPANELERRIFTAVGAVLGTEDFGVTHDFNRLGLTSLGAMALVAKLKKECQLSVTMKMLVKHPTVRSLAEAAGIGETPKAASSRRPRRATYPMTENQRGIYADWLRNPDALQYNIPAAFRFAKVSAKDLAAATEKVFASHPAFTAKFAEKNGEIVQARRDDKRLSVAIEKLDAEPDAQFFGSRMRPFHPDEDELARGTVFESPSASYLFLDIHHTVFDGFSVGLFLGELLKALGGEDLPAENYTAFDMALDERDYLESETVEEDDKWFARYLEGAESTEFPTSASGADGKHGEAGRARVRIAAGKIDARLRDLGLTASDWFLTAFTELLKRVGREEDVLINFVTAGRSNPETQETIGMFVKTLPIRGIRTAKTFTEAVRGMHGSVLELIDRERHSYVRLSERLGVRPNILFAFEGGIFDLPEGVELLSPETATVKAPLTAIVTPGKGDYELVLEYDRSMYSDRDMALLAGMFANLAGNAAEMPVEAALTAIPVLSPEETERVKALSKGEEIDYDREKTVINLIRANAIARPDATAVVDCETSITYGELERRSNALAARLLESEVKSGGFVGLMLPRRVGFVVSVVAVEKCGAGYVPLDADYPADRLAYMLENSEAKALVTTHELFKAKGLDFKGKVLFLDESDEGKGEREINHSTPDTPAYMIYTSGSTGKPKGVVLPNRAVRHFCAWTVKLLGITAGTKVATHPSFSFDASVMDIFPTLAGGGELHIYAESIRRDLAGMRDYIVKNGIEGGTMSTQIGMALLDTYPDLPLRYLVVGGEKLMPIATTKVKIVNGYGPTEFTVCSSAQIVDQSKTGDIPIGRANPGTWSLIVDRYGQLLPQGFAGELALSGPQIANGYWKLPEKTASVFVDGPVGRMYRTGDLARYNDEGSLDYMGRLDFQVKLRGFRIEIGEIEHRASVFPGVKGVAAEVRDVAGAKHLVLYYGSEKPLDETKLREHMASALTDYMVPDYFVRMDPLPLTPNGKINRKLLPVPETTEGAVEEYEEPANDTERKIADIYGETLKIEKFGATTDFFSAGGTSLIGIKAVVALQKAGLDVAYGDLFKYKTPRALAAFLTGASASSADAARPCASEFDYGAYDYKEIDRLLAGTPTDLFVGFKRHSLGDVLLCGATGYLGIHVLKWLLESTDSTVYVLIRPKRGVGIEKRLDSQYVYYFGEKVPKRFRDRLAFVEGDITDRFEAAPVNTVFNCAALVKHYVADDLMDRINVGGVENLIKWCEGSKARLVHISTYSVGGTISIGSPAVLDERHLYVGQESDNDYVRTKFLAERAVLSAIAAGKLRGKIMRLGNLMGREADGEFQMNVGANAFVNSLKSYKALGVYPLENLVNRIEMSPIDRVAEAVCLLATTPDEMCVFHPYNCYPLNMGAVIGAMNRNGYAVDCVSREDFAANVEALRNDPGRAEELQGILHYAGHILKDRRITPAPNDWTTTVLYRLGFRWKPADDTYLSSFLEMLDGLAVFD